MSNLVRHLTGSAELITIMNRFGQGQSYTKTLEIETSTRNTVTTSESVLPPSISTDHDSLIHFCWDNFDLNEETPSGSGTNHSTNDRVTQEVQTDSVCHTPLTTETRKVMQTNITELRRCFAKPKSEPNHIVSKSEPECDFSNSEFLNFV